MNEKLEWLGWPPSELPRFKQGDGEGVLHITKLRSEKTEEVVWEEDEHAYFPCSRRKT